MEKTDKALQHKPIKTAGMTLRQYDSVLPYLNFGF